MDSMLNGKYITRGKMDIELTEYIDLSNVEKVSSRSMIITMNVEDK